MTFHLAGCTGDYSWHVPQRSVAGAMASQVNDGGSASSPATTASFFFHLGDVVYKDEDATDPGGDDQSRMYNEQFYAPYSDYDRPIFAIAGNHDGRDSRHERKAAIRHFLMNFCAQSGGKSPDNATDHRAAQRQPYMYWRLDTPLAHIIGLYSNLANAGILDDPHQADDNPQYRWLVAQLQRVHEKDAEESLRKAVLLAVHFPPYSGASNFAQRGDPTLGPTHAATPPLAAMLQRAFAESGRRPDAVFSAHAHLYQRLTYRYADGWEVPFLVAGSGGHAPLEDLWKECDGSRGDPKSVPFNAVLPPGLTVPRGDSIQVMAHNDQTFGFLRMTITANRLHGEYFTAFPRSIVLADSFSLDLETHRIR